jgi:hypothetical protein
MRKGHEQQPEFDFCFYFSASRVCIFWVFGDGLIGLASLLCIIEAVTDSNSRLMFCASFADVSKKGIPRR